MTELVTSSDSDLDLAARTEAALFREINHGVDEVCCEVLFTRARSHNRWTSRPVGDETLQRIYNIAKWGPTSTNQQPMRLIFVRSENAKKRLLSCLPAPNQTKVMAAPVTAIIGYDLAFFERMTTLFPHRPEASLEFGMDRRHAEQSAFRNGTLQGAYLMLAARAVGLDVGPLSGFNNEAVDSRFFAGRTIKSNFLCCLGYGDPEGIYRRLPRLEFHEVAELA